MGDEVGSGMGVFVGVEDFVELGLAADGFDSGDAAHPVNINVNSSVDINKANVNFFIFAPFDHSKITNVFISISCNTTNIQWFAPSTPIGISTLCLDKLDNQGRDGEATQPEK